MIGQGGFGECFKVKVKIVKPGQQPVPKTLIEKRDL